MPGPEFFQTVMGRQYYEYHFPELVKQVKRLNDNLETLIKQQLESTAVQPPDSEDFDDAPEQCSTCGSTQWSLISTGWKCDECGDLA